MATETIVFQDSRATVTTHRLVADGATYNIAAINAVRVGHPAVGGANLGTALFAFAMFYGIITYVGASSGCMSEETVSNGKWIAGGLAAAGFVLIMVIRQVRMNAHTVIVTMGGVEVGLLQTTDAAWAARVGEALKQAMFAPR